MAEPYFKQIEQRSESSDKWKIAENAVCGVLSLGEGFYFLAKNSNPYNNIDALQFNMLNLAVGSAVGFIAGSLIGLYKINKSIRKNDEQLIDLSYQCSRL